MSDTVLTAVLQLKDEMSSGLTKVNDSLKKVATESTKTSQKLSDFKNSMNSAAHSLAQVSGLANAFSLVAIVNWMKSSIKETMAFSQEIQKLSAAIGISTDKLQAYMFAAQQTGTSTGQLQAAFRILQMKALEAANGGAEAEAAFLRLGINFKTNAGLLKDNDALFKTVIDALRGVENQAEKTALINEILGRGFVSSQEMINGGSEALAAYESILKRVGGVMSQETIQNADSLSKQIGVLEAAWNGLKGMLTTFIVENGILPGFVKGVGKVVSAVSTLITIEKIWLSILTNLAATIGMFISDTLGALFKAIKNLGAAMAAVFVGDFEEAGKLASEAWDTIANAPAQALQTIKSQFELAKQDIKSLWEEGKVDAKGIEEYFNNIGTAAVEAGNLAKKGTDGVAAGIQKMKAAVNSVPEQTDPDALIEEMLVESLATDIQLADKNKNRTQALTEAKKIMLEERKAIEEHNKKVAAMFANFNVKTGFNNAIEQWQSSLITFKDVFSNVLGSMQSGLSTLFQSMATKGHNWKENMKAWFSDVKRSFIKMLSDMLAQQLMMSAMGLLGLGGGASMGSVGGVQGAPGASAIPGAQSAPGVGGAGGIMGMLGMSPIAGLGLGLGLAGVGAAGMGMAGPNIGKNMGLGIIGGAAAGASLGSIIPGIGTLVGGVVGGALGGLAGFFGGKKSKKAKKKAKQAAAAAEAERQRQIETARGLIKTHVRSTLGGGNAAIEGAEYVSSLFSADISAEEIEKFGGAANVVARQQEIEGLAQNVQVSAPINVSVGSIASSYDVSRLSEDLGYLMAGSIRSALST